MTQRLVKGTHLAPLLEHEGFREILEQALTEDDMATIAGVQRSGWYPVDIVGKVWTVWAKMKADDPQGRYDAMKSAGELIAKEATSTFMRLIIRLLTPKVLANKWPDFWRKSHNFGVMGSDTSKLDDNCLRLTLADVADYPYIGPCAAGFVHHAFRSMGIDEPRVSEILVPVEQVTAERYTLQIDW